MKTLILLSALMLSGCGIANPQSEITGNIESVNDFYRSWDDNGEMVGSVIVLATEVKKIFVNDSPVKWNYTNIAGKQYVFISPVRIGDFYRIVRE
jgi:starvation-inducible outer membrane lipoprotein